MFIENIKNILVTILLFIKYVCLFLFNVILKKKLLIVKSCIIDNCVVIHTMKNAFLSTRFTEQSIHYICLVYAYIN